tara:strand:+ start:376 stop:609 length:234 start_codon:yes stop_codon:yes gene_type:complete
MTKRDSISLEDLKILCDKYHLSRTGTKTSLAERLSSLRGSYLTNSERKKILPLLKNNKNRKILEKMIEDNYHQKLTR